MTKSQMVTAMMTPAMEGRLNEVARAENISRSELIRRAIAHELGHREEGDDESAA